MARSIHRDGDAYPVEVPGSPAPGTAAQPGDDLTRSTSMYSILSIASGD